jgi:hypothetical protein
LSIVVGLYRLIRDMNIFCTNIDPVISAKELCDQHCRSKMQIESAILLQHCFSNQTLLTAPPTKKGAPRKSGKGYFNHPCAVWTRESKANFQWLVEHALEMFNERNYRWPDSSEHFTKTFIEWCGNNIDKTDYCKSDKLTPFAVAINSSSTCRSIPGFEQMSVQEQYQSYIKCDKAFATWTKRPKPCWY